MEHNHQTIVKNTAQFLIGQLAAWGIKRIYGVIGDANLYLLDELAKQDQIRYIACKHETGAALMASAEAKLTGKVGVCLATSGPGMVNLLNGLGDAHADQAGVLAITGQVETKKIGTAAKQYLNQQQMIHPLAVFTEQLAHPDALPEMMREALSRSQLHGEVTHLSIPMDLWQQPLKGDFFAYPMVAKPGLQTATEDIIDVANLLVAAKRPVILIGIGTRQVKEQVRQLAEKLPAVVITTMPAKMLFPNDHELYAGGLGQAGSEASTHLLAQSDLILILGATWWPDDYTSTQAEIIQVDQLPEHIGMDKKVRKAIIGDLVQIMPLLLAEVVKLRTLDDHSGASWAAKINQEILRWKAMIDGEAGRTGTPIPPQRVMRLLADAAEANAVIAVDTGDHTLWFNRIFHVQPDQSILISGQWRTLGFGIPAGIAAKLAAPERPVWVIAGDGAAVQTLLELHTAVLHGVNMKVIIINNGGYVMEMNRMQVSGLQTLGSTLQQPDFVRIAEACGAKGMRAENAEQLEQMLRSMAGPLQQPVLLDVMVSADKVPHTKV